MRKYNGRVSFVPAPGFEAYGKPSNDKSEATDKQNISGSSGVEPVNVQRHGYQGPEDDWQLMDWRTVDGPFVSIWLHNVPWASEDTMAAPQAKVRLYLFLFSSYLSSFLACLFLLL